MTDLKSIALRPQTSVAQSLVSYFPSEGDWKMMREVGSNALKSGMLPAGIKTIEAAAIIALKARELNMPIMVGFAHIHIINGKPTLSAELLQALARKNLPGLVINIIESTADKATVEFIRPEPGSKPYKMSFSIDDAKKAELLSNPTWKKYPSAMLWSRAVSAGLRKVCPEALMGVSYTPEEMGANVDEGGNVIPTTGRTLSEDEPQPVAPPVDTERVTAIQKIAELMKELEIDKDEGIRILSQECGAQSLKTATNEQLHAFLNILSSEKLERANDEVAPVVGVEKDPSEFDNFQGGTMGKVVK